MNKDEAVKVQALLDWVLALTVWEIDPDRTEIVDDEEVIRAIGILADRSHATLGAGYTQGEAIAGAMRLFELGDVTAPVQAAVDVVDLELPAIGVHGVHIGDGVYLAYDGWYWWLTTNRDEGVHRIALEPAAVFLLVGQTVRDMPEIAGSLRDAIDRAAS